MQVVIDSKEFANLMSRVEGLLLYEERPDDYGQGYRDGRNDAITQVRDMMGAFWDKVTR